MYYREVSRFGGGSCLFDGHSVRADEVEMEISNLMQCLVLPENWQITLQEMLNDQKSENDPGKDKARIKGEIRRMRESYNRGLYEGDEHTFWREIESLQSQLTAIEELAPDEIRQAVNVIANLQQAWQSATPDEKQELCRLIFAKIVYDFAIRKIAHIQPKSEYKVLFRLANYPVDINSTTNIQVSMSHVKALDLCVE
jgi:hypothetical protein